ncbi:MAG: flagella basal body P-ring formation protein FlgA [Planctomycetaceae bacterium]|nr:flagella basal body P-ring formation protein FlgA [Planctomycetaceae bacterium]
MIGMVLLAGVLGQAHIVAADGITLRTRAQVTGDSVKLRDIARLTGAEAERLGEFEVAKLREGQMRTTVGVSEVLRGLADHRPRWARLTLRGSTRVVIERKAAGPAEVSDERAGVPIRVEGVRSNVGLRLALEGEAETVREHLLGYVHATVGALAADIDVKFSDRDAAALNRRVAGERYEFEPIGSDMVGRLPIVVRCYQDKKLMETLRVRLHVRVRRTVLTATRELRRGEIMDESYLKASRLWMDSDPGRTISDATSASGQTVVRTIAAGRPIVSHDIKPATLVNRGEAVTVRCMSGNLMLTITARAMSDGTLDEVITVRHPGTRESFTARVTGPGQVLKVVTLQQRRSAAIDAAAQRGDPA